MEGMKINNQQSVIHPLQHKAVKSTVYNRMQVRLPQNITQF